MAREDRELEELERQRAEFIEKQIAVAEGTTIPIQAASRSGANSAVSMTEGMADDPDEWDLNVHDVGAKWQAKGRADGPGDHERVEDFTLAELQICGGAPDIKLPFVHAPTRVATAELRRQKLRLHKLRRSLLANEMTAQWVDTGNGRGGSGGVGRSGAMHPAVKAALSRAGESGLDAVPAARPLRTVTNADTSCAELLQWKPIRVPYQNHEDELMSKRTDISPEEVKLATCLDDPKWCDRQTMGAAQKLIPPMSRHHRSSQWLHAVNSTGGRVNLARPQYDSCAIVGNAEHLLGQGLGEYIDEHDAVLRINDGPQGSPHDVGEKTTHRIYNRNKSIKMCCNEQAAAALAPGTMILLWHPTDQAELLDACESKAPHVKTYAISRAMIRRFVDDIRAMRAQLRRLKVGKFTQRWRQMTSTSHAVASMLRMCGDVSLYGVNIDPRAPDASASDVAMRFDLEGERQILRLLHASGNLNFCSM